MRIKRAFSLVETLILVIVLAIALVASTPVITRKLINIDQDNIGGNLGGANHGRYEAFTKEKLIFGGNNRESYEKIANPSGKLVYIYEKINANTYEEIPDLEYEKDKATNDVIIPIVKAIYTDPDTQEKIEYVKGDKFIFEDGKLTYEIVKYNGNGEVVGSGGKLPDSKRMIEGNLARRNGTNSSNGRTIWVVEKSGSTVVPVPWERLYSGSKLVFDRAIPNDETGKPNAHFKVPENATNITIHAVGGGGAGGGVHDPKFQDSYEGFKEGVTPKYLRKLFKDNLKRRQKFKQQ